VVVQGKRLAQGNNDFFEEIWYFDFSGTQIWTLLSASQALNTAD
jgi:hypothetical protein